jgi:hypothetical protein
VLVHLADVDELDLVGRLQRGDLSRGQGRVHVRRG